MRNLSVLLYLIASSVLELEEIPNKMSLLPDQFLFINKNARSTSLSHCEDDQKFYIKSHVQTKRQHPATRPRQGKTSVNKNFAAQPSTVVSSVEDPKAFFQVQTPASARRRDGWNHQDEVYQQSIKNRSTLEIPRLPLGNIAIDPFRCTALDIDASTYRLLLYPFSGFSEVIFRAESLNFCTGPISDTTFRHGHTMVQRLRRCSSDRLTLYGTLTYSASALQWVTGRRDNERLPEKYTLKTIEALKKRIQNLDTVDSWAVLSIYALCIAEYWAGNYEAATTHLRIIRHLVIQWGGTATLDPYVLENILIGDKYLAISQLIPPVIPLDFDPGPIPASELLEIQTRMDPQLTNLGQGLFALGKETLSPNLIAIVQDIVSCIQVACDAESPSKHGRRDSQWLFRRHQALIWRLLSFGPKTGIQQCVRLALLVWLLNITMYFGAQRSTQYTLPPLRVALLQSQDEMKSSMISLLFWVTTVGALASEGTTEEDWFISETARVAFLSEMKTDDEYQRLLRTFFFRSREQGFQLRRLLYKIQSNSRP